MKRQISRNNFYYRITEADYLYITISNKLSQDILSKNLSNNPLLKYNRFSVFLRKYSTGNIIDNCIYISINSSNIIYIPNDVALNTLYKILKKVKERLYYLLYVKKDK